MKYKKRSIAVFLVLVCGLTFANYTYGKERPERKFTDPDIIGEIFDRSVSAQEFMYYFMTASMLSRSGKEDRTEDDVRQEAWENMVFRQGADELGLKISKEELVTELSRLVDERISHTVLPITPSGL